ncbi:hypothetical protein [Endozoicomonas sp. ALC013]|uniref:hypothetical protein n=1 Tax=Endozoicomonas sp. ALC013 TaxID=3403076 RepID=UPI003BB7822F
MENAFWQKKPLQGRQITSAAVLCTYGNETTSLRSGFFLQKLCLQNILHGTRKVSADQVIQEFNRLPDRNNKYKLAIARFKAECCLRGLVFKGQRVAPDVVVRDFEAIKVTLELARFKAECCLRSLPLKGRKVIPDGVVKEYPDTPEGKLGLARFKAECCLRRLPLKGQQITPDEVVKEYPDTPEGKLGMARFKAACCLRGLLLNGRPINADLLVKDYQAIKATLELARFRAECCLKGVPLNGQPVIPDAVVKGYQAVGATLELAHFKVECCLRSMPLNGQQVTPEEVVRDLQSTRATLELARFKEQCCLKGILLHGRQVTPDSVFREFPDTPEGRLGIARFKQECCLKGLVLHGQPVTPEAVLNSFPGSSEGKLGIARFKQECCLKGLVLHGQPVTPEAVLNSFPDSSEGKLGIARFKQECCFRGMRLHGQQVTPEEVVKIFPGNPEGKLAIVRFKVKCCLRGLSLYGQQITPDAVLMNFPDSPEGKLGIACFKEQCCLKGLLSNGKQFTPDVVARDFRAAKAPLELAHFKEQCCLRGLALNGRKVTPDEVFRDFPDSPEGRLGAVRFKQQCCLRSLPLNGQQITPDEVVKGFPNSPEGKVAIARFKAECCLMGLILNGRQVTPDELVNDFQAARAPLALARFKAECCLRGLLLNGQQVTPEEVVKDYERSGGLLEVAIFYSQLALNARKLNGNYLDNKDVLAAFNQVPGDHSSRQTRYLMQRLQQTQQCDDINEAQGILQEALQILNNVPVKDEQHRLQCLLKFMAMQQELTIDHQGVSAEQVLESINALRSSFQNSRLHFFFLAHCYITRQPIDGQEIHQYQVLECLQSFPEGSKLRHALGCWFEECSSEALVMDGLLLRENAVDSWWNSDSFNGYEASASQQKASVVVSCQYPVSKQQGIYNSRSGSLPRDAAESKFTTGAMTASVAQTLWQWSGRPVFPHMPVMRLNALTLKALEIIQEINVSCTHPPILITGSYARFLQNICQVFNDIDIICTTEKTARLLFDKLQTLNTDRGSEILKSIIISPIRGCQEIKLPSAYNIYLKDGDFGIKVMGLQVSLDDRVVYGNAAQLAVHVPGVERPVWCLSFAEETRLLNDTLEYLAEHLNPLTEQLQNGPVFDVPRTLLFNNPQNTGERIYGLLFRCLLTLNKARQFIALHSEDNPDSWSHQLQKEQQRLYALTENLHMKLLRHSCFHDFEHRVNDWLATTHYVSDYQIKRKAFVKTLFAMMRPGEDRVNSTQ